MLNYVTLLLGVADLLMCKLLVHEVLQIIDQALDECAELPELEESVLFIRLANGRCLRLGRTTYQEGIDYRNLYKCIYRQADCPENEGWLQIPHPDLIRGQWLIEELPSIIEQINGIFPELKLAEVLAPYIVHGQALEDEASKDGGFDGAKSAACGKS